MRDIAKVCNPSLLTITYRSVPSSKQEDVNLFLNYLQKFASHHNYLKHAGGIVLSTFAGQGSLFGFNSLNDAWLHVKLTIEQYVSLPVSLLQMLVTCTYS